MYANVDLYKFKCMGQQKFPNLKTNQNMQNEMGYMNTNIATHILYAFQHNKFTPHSFMYCKKKT
jgi:hypothetical protein